MSDEKIEQEHKPATAPVAPATAPAPAAAAAAKPAAPPPKVEAPSLPPAEMIGAELKAFLHEKLRSGEDVTIEIDKTSFTGRIFRTLIEEGWIAIEHVDGRRRPFTLIAGGRIRGLSGPQIDLPGARGK